MRSTDRKRLLMLRSKIAQHGDVVITTKGNSTGRTGYVDSEAPSFVYSPHLSYWRSLRPDILHPGFLRYWAKCGEFVDQLHAMAHSTDMAPYLSLTDQSRLKITLPTTGIQVGIATVLSALDDKIAVNDRIASTADELRASELMRVRNHISDHAEAVPLSSLAQFVNGKAFTKNATGTGRMVVRIAELNSGPGGSTVYNDIDVEDKHLARVGDILFAWSGSLTVSRWFRTEAIINQHIFKVIPYEIYPKWLVSDLIGYKLDDFKRIAADKATTMGHIQRRHLDEKVKVPSTTAIPALDRKLGPLWDRALAAQRESLSLIELRDALLPKLMSGEIRVRDAEKVVEEAV